jgi:hypothetical protein
MKKMFVMTDLKLKAPVAAEDTATTAKHQPETDRRSSETRTMAKTMRKKMIQSLTRQLGLTGKTTG